MNFLRPLKIILSILLFSVAFHAQAQSLCRQLYLDTETRQIESTYQRLQQSDSWTQKKVLSYQHLKVLRENIESLARIDAQTSPELQEQSFQILIKKVILNPREKLTASEIKLLAQNKKQRAFFEKTLTVLIGLESSARAIQTTLMYFQSAAKSPLQIHHESQFSQKALRAMQNIWNGPLRFLVPIIKLPTWNSPLDQVYQKLADNYQYEPNFTETQTLEKYQSLEAFKERKQFLNAHSSWFNFKRWLSRTLIAVTALHVAVVGNWALHTTAKDSLVTTEQFFMAPEYQLAPHQVRIYNETVPFPHMAIEIDGKVFSYGQTHMTVKNRREYLLSEQIIETLKKPSATPVKSFSLDKVLQATGLNKISRSVQMVTLNLDPAQKAKLRHSLELSTAQAYHNITLAMDCSTMVMQALQRNTEVPTPGIEGTPLTADASPSSVMMYMGLLKSLSAKNSLGEDLIGPIKQVTADKNPDRSKIFLRNLYINAMEAKIFLKFFDMNLIARSYLQLRYGEDHFQYMNPEVRREIESWQAEVSEEVLQSDSDLSQQVQIFIDEAQKLGSTTKEHRDEKWKTDHEQLLQVAHIYLNEQIAKQQEELQSSNISFGTIIRAGYRYSMLSRMEPYLQQLSETGNATLSLESSAAVLDRVFQTNSN